MAKDLVIVESPAKARTVGRFLGNSFDVKASMGHVRDLAKKSADGDVVNGIQFSGDSFLPRYEVTRGKGKIVSELKKASSKADTVYLATDPDREGEAISWHLMEAASIDSSKVKRVVFHEITKSAIQEAFDHPRDLDIDLVEAQQARSLLDKLVGYRLSPVLWRKVKTGLSAGRVQSVAVRMVVDKEKEIQAFVSEEFWKIEAIMNGNKSQSFKANLISLNGDNSLVIPNEEKALSVEKDVRSGNFSVANFTQKEAKRRPSPPFITSTLQQESSRRLRFSASRTMSIAQRLYEGKEIGETEEVGLITYMRTDSTNVSQTALNETLEFVRTTYGSRYAPDKPRSYSRRVQGAQEAHEAIRPTSVARTPDSLKSYLQPDEHRLYQLIWRRMVASQMSDSIYDRTVIDIKVDACDTGSAYGFRAAGSVLKFDGFRILYTERVDDQEEDNDEDQGLPQLDINQSLILSTINPEQNFTQPPPRFTEASLIRNLEKEGIGRPSTYATIMGTIQDRDYVISERGRFHPTILGNVVTDYLVDNFEKIMDIGFTSNMEKGLDEVANGILKWNPMLLDFYKPFDETVEKVIETGTRVDRKLLQEITDTFCEKCENPMAIKTGRYGRFLGCTGFPECKNILPLLIGVTCPKCKAGQLAERTRSGRPGRFFGCQNYPNCEFAVNSRPLDIPCPECDWIMLPVGTSNARCQSKECGYRGPISREKATVR